SDDVYQKYKVFTCNNAGTSTSSCSSNVDLRLVENCSTTCINGQCSISPVCTNRYATQLIAHSPAYTGYQPHPTVTVAGGAEKVLGAPEKIVHTSDVNFDNIGNTPGFVTVGFEGNTVVSDKTGNDVRIHLIDLNEAFEVFASMDGVSFISIGKSTATGPALQATQVEFDLSRGGLQTAKQIKIVNSVVQSGTNEGPDIDAIEIVSC
ncbi:MAG: hypothetical protein AABX16_00385, partial [Nanoarchaeota archaeon]